MIAQKAAASPEKKALLVDLAMQFDHKTFLPSIADVRAFLEMRGRDAKGLKQRPEAFRRVIKAIIDMPKESLEQMVLTSVHAGGPSQLGPLSDAIKFASAAVRSSGGNRPKNDSELSALIAETTNSPSDTERKQEKTVEDSEALGASKNDMKSLADGKK
ncbi:hypothetical protein AB9F38_31355 [Rhizobium leguminosarum]